MNKKNKVFIKKQEPTKKTDFKKKANQLCFYNEFCNDFRTALFKLASDYETNVKEYEMFQDLHLEEEKGYDMDFYAEYLILTQRTIEDMKNVLDARAKEYYDYIIKG